LGQTASVPAVGGLGLALGILSALLCLMFKLFSSARWARTRRWADAGSPPPPTTTFGSSSLHANGCARRSTTWPTEARVDVERGRKSSAKGRSSRRKSSRPPAILLHGDMGEDHYIRQTSSQSLRRRQEDVLLTSAKDFPPSPRLDPSPGTLCPP